MKKIVLTGDPNVGKSVLFSRLTGVDIIASNYPGTTVDYSKGQTTRQGEILEIIDAPGTYSLQPTNKAEEVAVSLLENADVIVNVIDATSLERCLYLTVELLQKKKPLIVALNMWDEAQHLGIKINLKELEKLLGVPVIPTVAITGEGIRELIDQLSEARTPETKQQTESTQIWTAIGTIVQKVQSIEHRHHSLTDRITDATVKPVTGILTAIVILSILFWLVRFVGESLISYVLTPLFEAYRPIITGLSKSLGPGFLHDVLIGKLIGNNIDYVQSLGMLTTGLYVAFGMVLPYIIAFYLALAILEDSGYLPRLATVTDNIFHRLGIHGHGIIPVLLGAGCNVAGVLSARALETRKQRFIAATLVSVTVPCMAQSAMIFGILGGHGMHFVLMVYGILGFIFLSLGLLLNRATKGESPELFLDIPPYRKPAILALTKKTWMRVRWYLAEAVPYLFLGVLIINVLNTLGIINFVARHTTGFMKMWFGLPGEAVPALLAGFLRKDLAVGMLVPLGLTAEQLVIAVTVLTLYFPCVATFAVLLKELGPKDMLKSAAVMISTALLAGGLLRILLI